MAEFLPLKGWDFLIGSLQRSLFTVFIQSYNGYEKFLRCIDLPNLKR